MVIRTPLAPFIDTSSSKPGRDGSLGGIGSPVFAFGFAGAIMAVPISPSPCGYRRNRRLISPGMT